ncbi:type II toxin-antitoxin system YafO family toxin [Pseudomonas asplenii]|uniref:type II toxin-antitoxin system YafO family toxin n=1 Tax=Pseudomonas asplenii TaxID=53407 RepID=UPI0037C67465
MTAVKVSPLFQQISNWQNFYAHFYNYKVCGDLPDIFGRDERLDLSDMHHMHLANNQETQQRWAKKSSQFHRTTLLNDPDNDFWLIYAYDDYHDEYLLLTIVGPDAHSRKEWGSYLRNIHNQIVKPWILGTVAYPDMDE